MQTMKNRISLLLVLTALLLVPSCKVEEEKEQLYSKDPVDLRIGTRASVNASQPDSRVDRLRVLAFDAAGQCQSNELYDFENTSLTSPFTHQMRPGLYTFVFIGNEPAASTSALEAVHVRSTLNNITFAASAFDRDDEIPMLKEYSGVEVLSTHKVKISGTEYSTWTISLERLAVRVDLLLKSVVDWDGTFTGVQFDNLPDYVPLFGEYAEATHSTQSAYTLLDTALDDTDGIRDLTAAELTAAAASELLTEAQYQAKYLWTKKIDRIILPSCLFTPITDDDRALEFTILLGTHTPSTLIGHAKPSNYTLQRNTNYLGELDIERPEAELALELQALDWDDVLVNGNPYRQLNVSHIERPVNNWSVTRVYFWSNQPEVTVDVTGYIDNTMTPFTVNNFFDDIAGSGAVNTVYNAATGQGYIELNAIHTTAGTYTRRIMLNAGGLKREVTLDARILTPPVAWSTTPYVGTFHRKTEVGERVIMGDHSGTWTASVDDPTGSGSFVNLSLDYTEDPNWYTNSPGDPENYPVRYENKTIVTGKGKIFFRVGLSGTTSTNRYATITLTHSGGTSKLYVRQGEDADYLMAPGDPDENNVAFTRSNAKKYSPYNLTTPKSDPMNDLVDRKTLALRGGWWTDYPTQAGSFFQWANTNSGFERIAYHPAGTLTGTWNVTNHTAWAWNAGTHETCPIGYRRPTGAAVSGTTTSEIGQSLLSNYGTNNLNNVVLGYYADGFFDRGAIQASANGFVNSTVSRTGNTSYDVAYKGALFFNPTTTSSHYNSSVFIPAAGYRGTPGGVLRSLGNNVYIWSSVQGTASDLGYDLVIDTGIPILYYAESSSKPNTFPIRCVAE